MNGPVLRDIQLPHASWWPPAPGWWLLAGALLLLATGIALWLRRCARRGPLRAALREIDALEAVHARDADDSRLVDGASRLMRRIALRVAPEVGAQTGEAWRVFVRRYARDPATMETLDRLDVARFRSRPEVDASAMLSALRSWCADALRGRVAKHADTRASIRQVPSA
jgi:hypothetical protein